jgi:hypothetical protein
MKRSALKRTSGLRSRRATPRRSERERDVDWMAVVRTMTCCARSIDGHVCEGPIEADHAGSRPAGRKANDDTTIPLCRRAHRERTDFSGIFRSWDKERMRAWLAEQVERTQAFITKLRERQQVAADREPPTYAYCWSCGRRLWQGKSQIVELGSDIGYGKGTRVRVHITCAATARAKALTAEPAA